MARRGFELTDIAPNVRRIGGIVSFSDASGTIGSQTGATLSGGTVSRISAGRFRVAFYKTVKQVLRCGVMPMPCSGRSLTTKGQTMAVDSIVTGTTALTGAAVATADMDVICYTSTGGTATDPDSADAFSWWAEILE